MPLPSNTINPALPQVVPGNTWVASTCALAAFVSFCAIIFTSPDRLRESLLVSNKPELTQLAELERDDSRDARNARLRGIQVERPNQANQPDLVSNLYRVRPRVENALDNDGAVETKVFVYAPLADKEDLFATTELSGVLRRPNALAIRLEMIPPEFPVQADSWILHRDTQPFPATTTLVILAASVLVGSIALTLMMSQNWIPNWGFNLIFRFTCLLGWPLRRYRDKPSVWAVYLVGGVAMLIAGFICVHARDGGMVIDSYWLECWAAATLLWFFGLAMIMRVVYVAVCPPTTRVPAALAMANQPEDKRVVARRPLISYAVSLRNISGGAGVVLFAARIGNNLLGQPVDFIAWTGTFYAMMGLLLTHTVIHWVIQVMARGFREKDYVPVPETPSRLERYRTKSHDALETAGFERIGAYRIYGSAFSTDVEFHLGCDSLVTAEFMTLSGHKAIEMMSMMHSGLCVVTVSVAAPKGKSDTQWTDCAYVRFCNTKNFQDLLRIHLGIVADLAEQNKTSPVVLESTDVVDVAKYMSRAHQDLKVQQGESSDRVGPATYGRFHFPTGLVNKPEAAVVETIVAENLEPAHV